MDTISLPISFRQGTLEKISDGTDEYYASLLALAMQIEPGELPLTPSFGSASPVFGDSEIDNLAITAVQFIPEIDLGSVNVIPSDNGQVQIDVTFTRIDE